MADDRPTIEDLIERSSLGTPEAKAARETADPEWARIIVWLAGTRTDKGIAVWLAHYRSQDEAGKARLRRIALTPDGGA